MSFGSAIEHGIETAAKDVAHVAESPFTFAEKAEKVLATFVAAKPELKGALTEMVADGEKIAELIGPDIAEKGLNFANDEGTLTAIRQFFADFKANVEPVILKVYGEIKGDLAAPLTPSEPVVEIPAD